MIVDAPGMWSDKFAAGHSPTVQGTQTDTKPITVRRGEFIATFFIINSLNSVTPPGYAVNDISTSREGEAGVTKISYCKCPRFF